MFIKSIKYIVFIGYSWLAAFPLSSCQKRGLNDDITVSARVEYLYETMVLNPVEMRVVMAEASRKISK